VSDWLVEVSPISMSARSRIIALPWAGGGTAAYRRWGALLPADVSLAIVRMPGRESRLRETPLTDMFAVVDELAPIVANTLHVPTMIFGYSLGALIGYEVAARLSATHGPELAALAVGGANAPHVARIAAPLSNLDDGDFVAALRALQGTPVEVLEHPELLALLLPALRADFRLLDTYHPRDCEPLGIPIITYSGSADAELTVAGVARWAELTKGRTTHRTFPGGHFFLTERPDVIVAAVSADLARTLDERATY
jgi:medium-chain acyl-[acyl-carrier-protein] hydrolase